MMILARGPRSTRAIRSLGARQDRGGGGADRRRRAQVEGPHWWGTACSGPCSSSGDGAQGSSLELGRRPGLCAVCSSCGMAHAGPRACSGPDRPSPIEGGLPGPGGWVGTSRLQRWPAPLRWGSCLHKIPNDTHRSQNLLPAGMLPVPPIV
eukprot:scaffold3728_cov417-Prasinococcus_capsulatus_cf.AAC.4